jgi:hypothetical protein
MNTERRHEGHSGGTAQDGGSMSENIRVRREEIAWPGTLPPGSIEEWQVNGEWRVAHCQEAGVPSSPSSFNVTVLFAMHKWLYQRPNWTWRRRRGYSEGCRETREPC